MHEYYVHLISTNSSLPISSCVPLPLLPVEFMTCPFILLTLYVCVCVCCIGGRGGTLCYLSFTKIKIFFLIKQFVSFKM